MPPEIIDKGSGRAYEAEAKMVCKRFDASMKFWQPLHSTWRRLMRTARMEFSFRLDDRGKKIYPWRSKLFLPEAAHLAETAFINIASAIFPKDEFLSILPARGQADSRAAFLTERILYQQFRQRNFKRRALQALLETVFLGAKVLRTHWVYEDQESNYMRQLRRFGVFVGQEAMSEPEIYDGPDFVMVPFYCIGIDPYALPGEIESADYITEDVVQPYAKFKADAEYFGYLPEGMDWVEESFSGPGSDDVKPTYDERGFNLVGSEARRVRTILFHDHDQVIYMASKHGAEQGAVVRIDDLKTVSPGGNYPYVALSYRPSVDEGVNNTQDTLNEYRPGCFFPLGILHGLVDMNEAMNALINSHFDIALLGMNAPWFMREGSMVDPNVLKKGLEPGRILEVSKDYGVGPLRENLEQMRVYDFMGPTFNILQQYLTELGKRQSGVTDPTIGGISPTGKTATEYMAAQQGAGQRFLFHANYITESGIIPLVQNYIELDAAFLSPDTALSLTGTPDAETVLVNPEDINRGCTVIIRPSANYNRLMMARIMTEFIPILKEYPFTNIAEVMRALVEMLSEIFDDPASIIPPQQGPVYSGQIQAMINQRAEATKGSKGGGNQNSQNPVMGDAEAEVKERASEFSA